VDVNEEVCQCISEVLNQDRKKVNTESDTKNLEGWDSLGHLQIIMRLEQDFKVRFTTLEIPELTSVRKLVEKIDHLRKLGK